MEIKTLQKSNTFASLASGGQRLGTWFDRRARKLSMKCSKSITLGKSKLCWYLKKSLNVHIEFELIIHTHDYYFVLIDVPLILFSKIMEVKLYELRP